MQEEEGDQDDDEGLPPPERNPESSQKKRLNAVRLVRELRDYARSDKLELQGNLDRWFRQGGRDRHGSVTQVRLTLNVLLGKDGMLEIKGEGVYVVHSVPPDWPQYPVAPPTVPKRPSGFGEGWGEKPEDKKARLAAAALRSEKQRLAEVSNEGLSIDEWEGEEI